MNLQQQIRHGIYQGVASGIITRYIERMTPVVTNGRKLHHEITHKASELFIGVIAVFQIPFVEGIQGVIQAVTDGTCLEIVHMLTEHEENVDSLHGIQKGLGCALLQIAQASGHQISLFRRMRRRISLQPAQQPQDRLELDLNRFKQVFLLGIHRAFPNMLSSVLSGPLQQPRKAQPQQRVPIRDHVVEVRPHGDRARPMQIVRPVHVLSERRKGLFLPLLLNKPAGSTPVVQPNKVIMRVHVDPHVVQHAGKDLCLHQGVGLLLDATE